MNAVMNKEVISTRQGISIMILFLIGTTLVAGGANKAQQDAWISISFAILMAIPLCFMYSRITTLLYGKNLFEIVEILFGRILGKIITILYTWYFFHIGSLVIRNITEFIQVVSFPDTPQPFVAIFMGLVVIYMIKSGIEGLGRWTEFVLPVVLFTLIIIIFLSAPKVNLMNLRPILYNGFKPVFQGAVSLIIFPFAETIVFTVVFSSLQNHRKSFKIYFVSILIAGLVIFSISIRNILVLGASSIGTLYFPSYSAVSLIDIGDFLQRIEVIVSVTLIVSSIAKLSVFLFATSLGIAQIFNLKNYTSIATPICLLMINLSIIIYGSTMEMFHWIERFLPYYSIPFQLIIPLCIWITAEIKGKSYNATSKNP